MNYSKLMDTIFVCSSIIFNVSVIVLPCKGLNPYILSCFFTKGFINGFFSPVKSQHAKETKCIAISNPYYEWEFR